MKKVYRSLCKKSFVSVLVVSTALSGCSVLNPHLPWDRLTIEKERLLAERSQNDAPSIREAIQYAHTAQDKLREKIGDQSAFRNGIAMAEIILAGAVGGAALLGSSTDTLIRGSVLGVTGLGLATWFDSTPRQRTYLLGIKALICAVDATVPLQAYDEAKQDLYTLNTALVRAETHLGKVKALSAILADKSPNSYLHDYANQEISRSEAIIKNGVLVYENGTILRHKVLNAGTQLETTVDKIGAHIVGEVIQTEAQLSQLRSLLQDLVYQAPDFVKLPDLGSFPKVKQDQGELFDSTGRQGEFFDAIGGEDEKALLMKIVSALETEFANLSQAVADVSAGARKIDANIKAVDATKAYEALEKCGVNVGTAIEPLVIDPTGVMEFKEKEAGRQGFMVSGGNGQYSGAFVGAPDGLSYQQNVAFGKFFDVIASSDTKRGDYRFVVTDTSGSDVILTVSVKPALPSQEAKPGGQVSQNVKKLQDELRALHLSVADDGVREAGKDTEKAMQAYLDATGYKAKKANQITTDNFLSFSADFASEWEDIEFADRNEALRKISVTALQYLLKEGNFFNGNANGEMIQDAEDPTIAAIREVNEDWEVSVMGADEGNTLETALKNVINTLRGEGYDLVLPMEDKL